MLREKIQSYEELKLYPDQEELFEAFFNWLDTDKPAFVISGGGGVGKSHAIDGLISALDYMMLADPTLKLDVHLTAPTHQACKVLSKFTELEAKTVHSFFKWKVEFNADTGKKDTKEVNRDIELHKGDIIFIDEASMINTNMLKRIMKSVIKHKARAVFVGDAYQINPVEEDGNGKEVIPVFDKVATQFFLTKIKRQVEGNPLIQAAHRFRKVLDGEPFPEIKTEVNEEGVGLEVVSRAVFDEMLIDSFKEEPYNNKMLSYTNKNVLKYNKLIRTEALGKPSPRPYKGEKLIIPEVIVKDKRTIFKNGEEFVVNKIRSGNNQGFKGWYLDTDRMVKPYLPRAQYERAMKNFGEVPEQPFKFFLPADWNEVNSESGRLKDIAMKKQKTHKVRKNSYTKIAMNNAWTNWYRFNESFHDLRQPFCVTAHKAQGSSYGNVFVDLDDISKCINDNEIARLLYVALSRSERHCIVTGSLPHRLKS